MARRSRHRDASNDGPPDPAAALDLTEGNDRGYGEFGLQPYGDVLEVSFLDERYRCATMSFVDTLWVVIRTTGDAGTR